MRRARNQSLARLLMAEGFFGEVFVALTGGVFLTGLALTLGAGPVALSLLAAVPFVAQLSQFATPWLIRRFGSRRRVVLWAFSLGRLLWLLPAGLAMAELVATTAVTLALAGIALMSALIMAASNGWTTWMADAVPLEERAVLFGRRARAVAAATLIASLGGGLSLDALVAGGAGSVGYPLLGVVAVGAGLAAVGVARRLPAGDPAPATPRGPGATLGLLRRRSFARVVGLFTAWNVAVGLPAPFWTLYMLEHLGMSFFLVSLHTVMVLVVRLLTNDAWARVIDRVGSHRVLIVCGMGIATIPVFWLFAEPSRLWPIFIEAAIAGVVWTGFNQAAFIQPWAVLPAEDRGSGLALFNVTTGMSFFAASLVGGGILALVGADARVGFFGLFVASAVLRLATALWALRLTEPGVSLRGFLVNFVGYGVLRRPSLGRQWIGVTPTPSGEHDRVSDGG